MLADHPLLPLYFYVNKHLVKPRVLGWYDNVINVVYSRDLALWLRAALSGCQSGVAPDQRPALAESPRPTARAKRAMISSSSASVAM